MSFRCPDRRIYGYVCPFIETNGPQPTVLLRLLMQSIAGTKKVFREIGCEGNGKTPPCQVSMSPLQKIRYPTTDAINLIHATEMTLNGIPGISVIHKFEARGWRYRIRRLLYRITTSKIPMKEAFDQHQVATAPWSDRPFEDHSRRYLREIGETGDRKLPISGRQHGVIHSYVVSNEAEYAAILKTMQEGYRGMETDTGGIFVEEFVNVRSIPPLSLAHQTPENLHCYSGR